MAYCLEIGDRKGRQRTVLIGRFPFTIGHDEDSDLVLRHRSVASRHATIERRGTHLILLDRSHRGTVFVDDEPVTEAVIQPGNSLRFGSIKKGDLKMVLKVNPLQVCGKVDESNVDFFPQTSSWNAIDVLSSSYQSSTQARHASGGAPKPDWERLLKFTLESSSQDVYDGMLDIIAESISFDRCHIILSQDCSAERIQIVASRDGDLASHAGSRSPADVLVSHQVLERVMKTRQAVLVSTQPDDSFGLRESFIMSGAKTAICLPLAVRKRVYGVLYVDRVSSRHSFEESDLDAFGPIAGLLALRVENSLLEKDRLDTKLAKKELQIAEAVQRSMYPTSLPNAPGYSLDGFSKLSYQVGGDYFDFFTSEDTELTWLLGAVSGKGLPSALYMVSVLATLRAHLRNQLGIEEIMERLESHVRSTFRSDFFMSMCIGKLNLESGVLTYCNAGHLPPLIIRSGGEVVAVSSNDPAFNLFPITSFEAREIVLEPGDMVMAYTDGVIQSESKSGEKFGKERLLEVMQRHRGSALPELRRLILEEIDDFTGKTGHRDDMTIVFIRRDH